MPQDDGRWFERADGVIFRMDDPDHIKRMLSEGWREVPSPHAATEAPAAAVLSAADIETPDETPEAIQARNDLARRAFSATPPDASTTGRAKAKPIRKASERVERSVQS